MKDGFVRCFEATACDKRRILLVPLDWGLGHATRLASWVQEAVDRGDKVWIGGSGQSGAWLKARFPDLPYEEAPTWTIQHTSNLAWDLLKSWRSYRRSLRDDKQWATDVVRRLKLTHLVSDHRLGLRAQGVDGSLVHHVLMMHQLTMALPLLWRWPRVMQWVSLMLWGILRPYWSSFDEIVIPDSAHRVKALAPHLSHFPWVKDGEQWSIKREELGKTPRFRYTGWRSRFEGMPPRTKGFVQNLSQAGSSILVILSGPEPARSRLEAKVITQWQAWSSAEEGNHAQGYYEGGQPEELWLVRGVPDSHGAVNGVVNGTIQGIRTMKALRVWDSPDDQTMYSLLLKADWIVGRPGYSSLMDYACLRAAVTDGKPWRFCAVQARGHSEQAYLGQRLKRLGQADFRNENTFDLREAWLDRIKVKFTYSFP